MAAPKNQKVLLIVGIVIGLLLGIVIPMLAGGAKAFAQIGDKRGDRKKAVDLCVLPGAAGAMAYVLFEDGEVETKIVIGPVGHP